MGENLDKFYARVRWIKDVWHLTYISSRHSISPLAWSHSCGLCLELGSKEKECVQNFKGIMAKSLRRWFGLFAALSGNIWDPIPQRNRGVLPPWGSTVKGRVHMFWIFRKGENEVLLVLLFCFFFLMSSLIVPTTSDRFHCLHDGCVAFDPDPSIHKLLLHSFGLFKMSDVY